MHIRAVGESPDAAESVGIPVKRIKYIALCLRRDPDRYGGRLPVHGICRTFLIRNDCRTRLYRTGDAGDRGGKCSDRNACIPAVRILPEPLRTILQNSSIPLQFIQMMPYLIIIIAYTIYCAMVEHNKKKKQMKAAAGK